MNPVYLLLFIAILATAVVSLIDTWSARWEDEQSATSS
jgi:hypothetical protein